MSNEIEYDEIKYLHVSFVVEHLLPYLIDLLLISSRSLFWVRKSKTFDQNHCILWMQWMTKIGHMILENKVFRKLKLSKLFFTKNRGPIFFFNQKYLDDSWLRKSTFILALFWRTVIYCILKSCCLWPTIKDIS